jgi:hypothetical protein
LYSTDVLASDIRGAHWFNLFAGYHHRHEVLLASGLRYDWIIDGDVGEGGAESLDRLDVELTLYVGE